MVGVLVCPTLIKQVYQRGDQDLDRHHRDKAAREERDSHDDDIQEHHEWEEGPEVPS